MQLDNITYHGPALDDEEILANVPSGLAGLLRQINGFVQFHGGLHVRGACLAPDWHSLRNAWHGDDALHLSYQSMLPSDVPFAEDCLGDQYFLREGAVWKLEAETDEAESVDPSLGEFLRRIQNDPVEELGMQPLLQFMEDEGRGLNPGELLAALPPFCTEQAADGVELSALPALERRRFLSQLAAAVRDLPEGAQLSFEVED